MAKKTKKVQSDDSKDDPKTLRSGKDEMNLAEHPLHFLTNRTETQSVKTLVFHDSHGKLTVTGSDALGLPTPIDVDVLIALMEIAKKRNDFEKRTVNFTRYEVILKLGWANVGSSYKRLEESMNRWAGVLLIYDGNFYDNRLKQYVKETMHIISNITIAEGKAPPSADGAQAALPLSSFDWDKRFFQSFQDSNIKNLNTEFYFSLDLPTSKQLFRFLDKRFYRQAELTFDLREIGRERVGLSRNYVDSKLKEKLSDAIKELETAQFNIGEKDEDGKEAPAIPFLKPLSREERYFKTEDGWKIRFIDGRKTTLPVPPEEPPALAEPEPEPVSMVAELRKRGVAARTAKEFAEGFPLPYLLEKIEAFDFEMKSAKPPRKPAGFLVAAIREGFSADPKFVSSAEREKRNDDKRAANYKALAKRRKEEEVAECERQWFRKVADYRQLHTPEQLAQLEATALAQADADTRRILAQPGEPEINRMLIYATVDLYIRRLLESKEESA